MCAEGQLAPALCFLQLSVYASIHLVNLHIEKVDLCIVGSGCVFVFFWRRVSHGRGVCAFVRRFCDVFTHKKKKSRDSRKYKCVCFYLCAHTLCDLCALVCLCVCGLCDLSRVCINCVLDQCRACSVQGRPVIINKLPVPAEMPPGPVSAPPPFPWGLSGQLPAGKALFCSITANAVVCHFPLHFLIIFSSGICYRIKTKRRKKTHPFCESRLLGF